MSASSGGDFFHHSGYDSNDEGSVPSSHASDMPDTPGNKKRPRQPTQIRGKAWVFYGLITADAALLHAESDDNEEGPFPRLKSLLLAHWTSIHPKLEDRIKTLILHLAFFCNLTSLLACSRDENDASKVQIRIRAFLQSKKTAVTALVKLLPQSRGFFPVHGSDVKAASRDTRCMKSACRPKQPAPTIGCRCSKSANSATKRLRDQREAAPKRYAVMNSD